MDLTDETWLVSGGAGYIGAHVVRSLQAVGADVVVVDDLSSGDRRRVDCTLVQADIGDFASTLDTLRRYRVSGVIHLAAKKQVEESVRLPLMYYDRNVTTTANLLRAMHETGVDRLVFSSSAAVYGVPDSAQVGEDDPTVPVNPYGTTKLIGEWLVRDQARAVGLRYAALRYFNVAGAGSADLGDSGVSNLIPMVFQAVEQGRDPTIFGDRYPTPDGTCVRDFIHVADLSDAHVAAIALLAEPDAAHVLNVGCGQGFSVRQVIEVASDVIGRRLTPQVRPARAGDPASVVADAQRLRALTAWQPRFELREMVDSAWQARGRQV